MTNMAFLEQPNALSLAFLDEVIGFVNVNLGWNVDGEEPGRGRFKSATKRLQSLPPNCRRIPPWKWRPSIDSMFGRDLGCSQGCCRRLEKMAAHDPTPAAVVLECLLSSCRICDRSHRLG